MANLRFLSTRGCSRTNLGTALFLAATVVLSSCSGFSKDGGTPRAGYRLPLPSKDDVALVDGRPFTLSTFLDLRAQLGKKGSAENTFRLGTSAIAVQLEAARRGVNLDSSAAIALAGYSLGHGSAELAAPGLKALWGEKPPTASDALRQIDEWVARSVILRNPQVLAGLPAAQ